MKFFLFSGFLGISLFLIFNTGCGHKTVTVSGKVIFDGKPGVNIAVLFQGKAVNGQAPAAAFGLTNAQGEYSLSLVQNKKAGAFPGEYAVYLSWKNPNAEPVNIAETTEINLCPYKIPGRATSGEMMFTVPPEGTQNADFEFDSAQESIEPVGV
ncbi:MAG: hypothetical protein LBQ50_12785 [Planctomycetaceae bacterium]|jgi:hypothetical protein|nr:hypothetical protein [Planctomycetaceae bacterium]